MREFFLCSRPIATIEHRCVALVYCSNSIELWFTNGELSFKDSRLRGNDGESVMNFEQK